MGKNRDSDSACPIAIVGMACRFPGAPDILSFWKLLESGGNAVSEIVPGTGNRRVDEIFADAQNPGAACRFCAYVDGLEQFDAGFFRISPAEAQYLDPQQRMILETSWQALEDAGIDPAQLMGSRTGVYTGISNDEYRMKIVEMNKPAEAASCLYALSGTNLNGTSGRTSFVLGLMGPAKAVDAACASSLVSVHDAVADLQQGKADLAIAGGVQAILNGRIFELRADSMMLSPDGQCKAFDASANGYVRGEGCGAVVLKRLSEAEADGDRIWGVIRGAVVNHGGAGTGLTVPHTPALRQVMEDALRQSGIPASEIDYLEAHGTGTSVGDPIEIEAVADVFGKAKSDADPLLVGSVKTNLGHLESAAGIAGLIKAVLVLQTGVVPKHLHFRDPNPSLDWDRLPLQVTAAGAELPARSGRPRRAGVNSFGISGTNAHIIVEEHIPAGQSFHRRANPVGQAKTVPAVLPASLCDQPRDWEFTHRDYRLLPLSGKSQSALRDSAAAYLSWLDEHTENSDFGDINRETLLADMAWTAGVGRSHFEYRTAITFADEQSLRDRLGSVAAAGEEVRSRPPKNIAFAYTGQGSQWAGMGMDLYHSEPVARAVFDRCEEVFRQERDASLLEVMFSRGNGHNRLDDTAWEQPALYALGCALTALWSSLGIRPAAVIGHSVGEIAAAQAAGVFSLEDGMRFAAARGTLLSSTAPGGMAAIFASPDQIMAMIESMNSSSTGPGLCISADNGMHQVVSGTDADIEKILHLCVSNGVRARKLNTSRAFHSALVEPALAHIGDIFETIAVEAPSLTMISNLTGSKVTAGQRLDAAYWMRHAREAVDFAGGVRTLADLGIDLLIEIGPRQILSTMAMSAWPEEVPSPHAFPSLQPPPSDGPGFPAAVADAYQAGLPICFQGLFAGEQRRRISLPGYPFQRQRHWLQSTGQRRTGSGLPLLGSRHDSAGGATTFESRIFPSDPEWMRDHRVFGRVIAPGAMYAAMAALAARAEGNASVILEDMQLHNALVFKEAAADSETDEDGRQVQIVLDQAGSTDDQRVRVFSREDAGEWVLHVEGRVVSAAEAVPVGTAIDLEGLKTGLSPVDARSYYNARAETGIELGPSFRTLESLWSRPGEAVGEINFPAAAGDLDVHPLILDGCFQVVAAARNPGAVEFDTTYLPFGWERMWLAGRLPERIVCHVRMDAESQTTEVLSGELNIYDTEGVLIGGLSGYTVKRATRAALLSSLEGVDELLYNVTWRESTLKPGIIPAGFLQSPQTVASGSGLLSQYLAEEGVDPGDRNSLLNDLERWSRSRALETLTELGWRREIGEVVEAEDLRRRLKVVDDHQRLFRRMLEMLAWSGVLEQSEDSFTVKLGPGDPLPDGLPEDIEAFVTLMTTRYPHGLTEIGLFQRCGSALADVLRGKSDPLTLLFSSGDPTPADLYLKAPVARAANRILKETVQTLLAGLPQGRILRVIEVGAGTGSATAAIIPKLPEGRFSYTYTDISAGFFAEAEDKFGTLGGSIQYRPLDIEKDPIEQGFDPFGYDLLIASNVLHATRYLEETLGNCRRLLAPSGTLVALENLSGFGWMDLTFGQLDGWWRFADAYRPHHALAGPAVWRSALSDTGFRAVEILGLDESDSSAIPDKGVIVARGPEKVSEAEGSWILAADSHGEAERIAAELASRNQKVLLAMDRSSSRPGDQDCPAGVDRMTVDFCQRDSWHSLAGSLPADIPFHGVVHLTALDGHGAEAANEELAEDIVKTGSSALALIQGILDSDITPEKGIWFLTRGAQFLEREQGGELTGALLWGFGKAVDQEAAHLQPKMIDLEPGVDIPVARILNELLYPDQENHVVYRFGRRQVARLVRSDAGPPRLKLPDESNWVLAPDPGGVFETPCIKLLPERELEAREVRVAVHASGLNFWDVFRSLGFIEEGDLGREVSGRILEVGSEVSSVKTGDHVVGLGFGAFAEHMVTREELVTAAPAGFSASGLATIPSAFVSAQLSYEFTGLRPGDRVLIHAGAGGVGLAAVQLAQAAGAEVFATASAPKQEYLRSLGVRNIFDSRTTDFGSEILDRTDGSGVSVVLNSLTSEGFIEASLSCLADGGRFVELARRDILSEEEMAERRPDVSYAILELDVLKKTDPAMVGRVLRDLMARIETGDLKPLIHSRWPLAEAGSALRFMRSARHLGKIVVTTPPVYHDRLRNNGLYLVTGGLGGIGCAVAEWLAEHGAGVIVLNGRRPPDPDVAAAIESLRGRGFDVRVELADVSKAAEMDAMLARLQGDLPLAGVIHSVGVLSDGALTNQSWSRFEEVLWPKILGAWHLHRATADLHLDLFVLFSSRVGVMGNPGQSNHAAANAFLDQLAGHRRALGLPGLSIAWGAWSEIGEAAEQRDRIERQRAARGGRWFTPQQGLKAFERLLREDATNSVVMSMDWSVFEDAVDERQPLLEELLSKGAESEAEADDSSEALMPRLASATASEREDLLAAFLQRELQAVLRLPSAPDSTVGFFDLGMDSLMAVELRNRLNRAFGSTISVSNTAVFDYPDISTLASHLAGELGDTAPEPAPEALPPRQAEIRSGQEQIAVIGMSCRLPGAPDISTFWQQLVAGFDAVTDGRRDGGDWSGIQGDPGGEREIHRWGAYLDGIDRFDARFFGIRPIEARMMDPRQRLLLEESWQAFEDAGIDSSLLRGSRTGVYIGMNGSSEYRDLIAANGLEDSYLGTAPSVAIGRIAYTFGLMGPAVPIDMTCASSLVAVHQAAAALRMGEVDLALAGGVHAALSPSITGFLSELGMLSTNGRCMTFDAAADGFVRGEGCGILVLKRLRDAEADGDRIWGLVRGSAVNQNGASAALTVPNGTAQRKVLEEAVARAEIPPSEVDYLEAHATGSQLGDPIEVSAVAEAYGRDRNPDNPLRLGTVKTNIGHLEPAAGVVGLIKVLLAMKHGMIPGNLHIKTPNPLMDWDSLPVSVMSEPGDWPRAADYPRRAGVSAFALSGTNAHIIVEEYEPADDDPAANGTGAAPVGAKWLVPGGPPELEGAAESEHAFTGRRSRMLPLSGKSESALKELAENYLIWIDEHLAEGENETAGETFLPDMAWTACRGRSHFPCRSALMFENAEELRAGLAAVADSERDTNPMTAAVPAFVYASDYQWNPGMWQELSASEPVVRAVLERCDRTHLEMHGISLFELMFGDPDKLQDPELARPVVIAQMNALTAFWSSIGVHPGLTFGTGAGELSAMYAAGMITLEQTMQVAARPDTAVETAQMSAGSRKIQESGEMAAPGGISRLNPCRYISPATGQVLEPGESVEPVSLRRKPLELSTLPDCVGALVENTVDLIFEIGTYNLLAPEILNCWPGNTSDREADSVVPAMLSCQLPQPDAATQSTAGFYSCVAGAYEAGLTLDFDGLFAGEHRRRIAIPGYPFQRRRFWFES